MNESKELLKIIQTEVQRAMSKMPHVVYKYPAKVTAVSGSRITVVISGYDTSYTFLNKTNVSLSVGNYVFVEAVSNDLTNGFISEKFG